MVKDPRLRLVSAPFDVQRYDISLRFSDAPPTNNFPVSVVICTLLDRESIGATLKSLEKQSWGNFEVILVDEPESLAIARQRGLESSRSSIVVFIDDDVVCPVDWLGSIMRIFNSNPYIIGVTGPTEITDEYKQNRDLFKFSRIKRAYDRVFLDGLSRFPGRISSCGAPTTASNDRGCKYSGPVDYLECCNFGVRRADAIRAGGFDPVYTRTSEWSEPDLAIKLGQLGYLYFCNDARLRHYPSKSGVYNNRLSTTHRWKNFKLFQQRWVKPSIKRSLYQAFIWTYLKMKQLRLV